MEGPAANNLWPSPGLQELPVPVPVVSCACGAQHTLLLSGEGLVFALGAGPQLGLGDVPRATSPAPRLIAQNHREVASFSDSSTPFFGGNPKKIQLIVRVCEFGLGMRGREMGLG